LNLLYNQADQFKITQYIHHELNVNYGISMTIGDAAKIATEVLFWWGKFK
jgi:hypothetical protein